MDPVDPSVGGRVHGLPGIPEFETQVVPLGQGAGAAHQGDRRARLHGLARLLEQLLIPLVHREDVAPVLDREGPAVCLLPARKDDGAVQDGHHRRAGRGRDVHPGVERPVEALGHDALERGVEREGLDGQVAPGPGHFELLRLGHPGAQEGVPAGQEHGIRVPAGLLPPQDQAVQQQGLLPRHHFLEIFRVEFPLEDLRLQRIDADGVLHGLPARLRVGIAGNEGSQRRKGDQEVENHQQEDDEGDDGGDERRPREDDGPKALVGHRVDQRSPVFPGRPVLVISHKKCYLCNLWTD